MSSYHIVTEDCSFDFLPSCSIRESVLMIRRLSVESLREMARMMNSLAERLEENNDGKVSCELEKNEKVIKCLVLNLIVTNQEETVVEVLTAVLVIGRLILRQGWM